MFEVVCLSFAFIFGSAVRFLGLPPLIGFLAAGFAINYFGTTIGLPKETNYVLQHLAHLGVLMLLFTVGLKIKFKQIVKPEVVWGSLAHFAMIILFFAPILYFAFSLDRETSLFIAICLGFSSTVLAAKLLQTKKELGLFHGRTTIGILIAQDIIALAVLAIWSGKTPNAWALLVFTLPLLRPVLHRIVDMTGHGELMVIVAMLFSLVIGGSGFEAMGLSSEIGALLMGALLANHPRAGEISDSLWSLKEIFLVCFFLQIGMSGLPTIDSVVFAAIFAIILPIKTMLFYGILIAFKLRARTSLLSSFSLTSYSEFGLIVVAAVMPDWLVTFALTVTFSFIISAPLNRYSHPLFEKYEDALNKLQRSLIHPDEQPKDLGEAEVLIFGMGRTGTAAYKFLESEGMKVVGLDADQYTAEAHVQEGRNAFFADAEDSNFWRGVDLKNIKAAILAMDDIEAKLISVRMLKKFDFKGPIVSHALHHDHQERIKQAGATHTYLTMTQAGLGLAESTVLALTKDKRADDGDQAA